MWKWQRHWEEEVVATQATYHLCVSSDVCNTGYVPAPITCTSCFRLFIATIKVNFFSLSFFYYFLFLHFFFKFSLSHYHRQWVTWQVNFCHSVFFLLTLFLVWRVRACKCGASPSINVQLTLHVKEILHICYKSMFCIRELLWSAVKCFNL